MTDHAPPVPRTPVIREIDFGRNEQTGDWNPGAPEFAAAANSVSLMMPFVEPYFVGAVRQAIPDLDPDLARVAQAFAHQELCHQAEHRRFNRGLVDQVPALGRVEGWMRSTYRWLRRTRSLRFNLAFAAASETIAYSLARWTSDHMARFLRGADPSTKDLFLWHLAEEVEHKSVAYDVHAAVDDSRLRYAWAGVCSLALLAWFSLTATLIQLRVGHRLWNPLTWARLVGLAVSFAFELLPTMFVSALPGHHPSQFADPEWYGPWLADLEARRSPGRTA